MPGRNIDRLHLFVTTWNMGGVEKETFEATIKDKLPIWVPKGYDLYILGVQECCCLREMRQFVQDYLGGTENYTLFGAEIGDSTILHGHIAITVFARTKDVQSGACQVQQSAMNRVATGVSVRPIICRGGTCH